MWKSVLAVVTSAYLAAVLTILSAPADAVSVSLKATATPSAPAPGCETLAWPYSLCADGSIAARGKAIRLISVDRPAQ